VTEFCNAVDKDGHGIEDPNAHLQCYQIKDAPGQARFESSTDTVDNEFGDAQPLTTKKAKRICVPAGRDGAPPSINVDRFKCYSAKTPSGSPKFSPVASHLQDAFANLRGTAGPKAVGSSMLLAKLSFGGTSVVIPTTMLTLSSLKVVRNP